jgi:hypothetical protein
MKTLLLICIVAMGFSINLLKENEQGLNIAGKWGIIDLTYITPEGTQKVMEAEIKSGSAVTNFYFMNDGKFKQTSNMSGSGTLDAYEGLWKLTGNKLIITLQFNGQPIDVDYTCEMKNELLVLTRTSPDGKMSIVNTFRKK